MSGGGDAAATPAAVEVGTDAAMAADGGEKAVAARRRQTVTGFLMHGGSSIGLSMVNKALMSGKAVTTELVLVVLVVQGVFAVAAGAFLAWQRVYPFMPFTMAQVRATVLVAFLFTVLVHTGLQSLAHAPVSMVIVFRNMAPLVTSILEGILHRRLPDRRVWALLLLLVSAIIYSSDQQQASVSAIGIFWLVVNLLVGCSLNLLENHTTRHLASVQTPAGVAQLRNVLSQGFILAFLIVAGRPDRIATAIERVLDPGLAPVLFTSCVLGFTIGLANYLLQALVTSTSMSVANCAYKILTVALSVLLWERTMPPQAFVGVCLSFVGVVMYLYLGAK